MYKKIAFLLLLLNFNSAMAGELKSAGTILTKDSYVFTVDEAKRLEVYVDELEQKVDQQEKEIAEYEKLDIIFQDKEKTYQEIMTIKDTEIEEYQKLHQLDTQRVEKLERHEKLSKYERAGFFVLGIVISAGSIMIADNIDDSIETN